MLISVSLPCLVGLFSCGLGPLPLSPEQTPVAVLQRSRSIASRSSGHTGLMPRQVCLQPPKLIEEGSNTPPRYIDTFVDPNCPGHDVH